MTGSGRLEVGRIGKAHGIRGEVQVTLTSNRTDRLDPGSVLFAADREFVVRAARAHQKRWIVHFEGIPTRNAAEELRGLVLLGDPLVDPDELWAHDLIGRVVRDLEGTELGTVTALELNPASDLLVLDDEGLVPLTFFVEQADDGAVIVDPPQGLLSDEEE